MKRGRKLGSLTDGSLAHNALKIVAGGAITGIVLSAFIVAPGLTILAKPLLEYLRDKDKRQWRREQVKLRKAIDKLRRRRLVKFVRKNAETYILITKEGGSLLRKFDIAHINIFKPERWDRNWRLVLFDIPEKYKAGRNALRDKLVSLGFYRLQKSVLVYPYECLDEVDFITRFFGIEKYIQYVRCGDLGQNEAEVRKFFNLLI